MKRFSTRLLSLSLAFVVIGASPHSARGDVSVSFDLFYDALEPYGDWVEVGDYGYCFHPRNVAADWAPYTDGYWAYTDAGWTWVSYEDFGWATYHYGRWVRVVGYGWVWVPGSEWGPAWVSWRSNDDYIGWAPLPPEAHFRRDTGISFWVDSRYDIGPSYYNFCPVRAFGNPVLRPVIVDRGRNVAIIQKTKNITNITVYNNGIYNGGPSYRTLEERSEKRVQTLRLDRRRNVEAVRASARDRRSFNRQDGNTLIVTAPEVLRPDRLDVRPVRADRKFKAEEIDKGWRKVGDDATRDRVRKQMRGQAQEVRPEQAPARPVSDADLAPIPKENRRQAQDLQEKRDRERQQPEGRATAEVGRQRGDESRQEAQQTERARQRQQAPELDRHRERAASEQKQRQAADPRKQDEERQREQAKSREKKTERNQRDDQGQKAQEINRQRKQAVAGQRQRQAEAQRKKVDEQQREQAKNRAREISARQQHDSKHQRAAQQAQVERARQRQQVERSSRERARPQSASSPRKAEPSKRGDKGKKKGKSDEESKER